MIVWQKAMDVTIAIYSHCKKLPKMEMYALPEQTKEHLYQYRQI
ncbi:MAG: four helix bundle protein [Chitinispirillales bacterium]|nr:four helix bundle protein [Chitinispirillales bacterium]